MSGENNLRIIGLNNLQIYSLANFIISQYGGSDGELGAALRYLSQRFGMPDQNSKAILNDIGTEELVPLGYQL